MYVPSNYSKVQIKEYNEKVNFQSDCNYLSSGQSRILFNRIFKISSKKSVKNSDKKDIK